MIIGCSVSFIRFSIVSAKTCPRLYGFTVIVVRVGVTSFASITLSKPITDMSLPGCRFLDCNARQAPSATISQLQTKAVTSGCADIKSCNLSTPDCFVSSEVQITFQSRPCFFKESSYPSARSFLTSEFKSPPK